MEGGREFIEWRDDGSCAEVDQLHELLIEPTRAALVRISSKTFTKSIVSMKKPMENKKNNIITSSLKLRNQI